KFFFINYLRRIFLNYSFMLFLNILKKSTSEILKIKSLKFKNNLNSIIVNSFILKSLVKKDNKMNILPGNYLVLYTNIFTDILFYITNLNVEFVNFVPFALLFQYSFIFLDAKALKYFLIAVSKVNNLTLFFNLFTIYK